MDKIEKIFFVSHHLAHAHSAFYSSGFKEAACLVIDCKGSENDGKTLNFTTCGFPKGMAAEAETIYNLLIARGNKIIEENSNNTEVHEDDVVKQLKH